jgi:hypothetical protein
MKADILLGGDHQTAPYRDPRGDPKCPTFPATEEAGRLFSICKNEPVLSRQYPIIIRLLLEAELSPVLSLSGGDPAPKERVRSIAMDVMQKHGAGGIAITARSHFLSHVGLGIGSQLGPAVARAIRELHGRHLSVKELTRLIGRGGTSVSIRLLSSTGASSLIAGTGSLPWKRDQISAHPLHYRGVSPCT